MDKIFKTLQCLILASAMLLLGACTAKHSTDTLVAHTPAPLVAPPTKADGGQDGGGGKVTGSTPDEVIAAIHEVLKMAIDPPPMNIFLRFVNNADDSSGIEAIKNSSVLKGQHLVQFVKPGIGGFSDEVAEIPILRTLKYNKIVYRMTGDCIEPQRKNADAAVSSFDSGAEICFSVGNMTRIPPESLVGALLPLLFHELAHLSGAGELEAQYWQDWFGGYYTKWINRVENGDVEKVIPKMLSSAGTDMWDAINLNNSYPRDQGVYFRLGKFLTELEGLPYLLDPLAMKYALKPKHPELVDNYINSVLALYQKIFDHVYGKDYPGVMGVDFSPALNPAEELTAEKFSQLLGEWSVDFDVIEKNFDAYVNEGVSKCVLPYPADSEYEVWGRDEISPLLDVFLYPPQICDDSADSSIGNDNRH